MTVPVQSVRLFPQREIWIFEANSDELLMMMTTVGFLDEPKRRSDRFSGLRLVNRQVGVFYLNELILCRFFIGQVKFCWRKLARLIEGGMLVSARGDLFRGTVPVIAALSVFLGFETAIVGNRRLIEFWCRLNWNKGKLGWSE
jgi:hypothetical protein